MTQAFDRIVHILYRQFMLYVLHLIEPIMLWPQANLRASSSGWEVARSTAVRAFIWPLGETVRTTVTASIVEASTRGWGGGSSASAKQF